MQKLILVRHAKALDRNKAESRKISDSDRPLTPKGIREFKKHIQAHKKYFSNAELFVSSPYVRAIETLDIILDELGLDSAPIKIISKITPDDKFDFLIKWLKKRKEKVIVVVSHQPFLTNFLNRILSSDELSGKLSVKNKIKAEVKIKKGAVIVVNYEARHKKYKLDVLKNPGAS